MVKRQQTFIVSFFLLLPAIAFAQDRTKVTIEIIDTKGQSERKSILAKDSLQAFQLVNEQLYQLYFSGYLGAEILEESRSKNELHAKIFKGEQYLLKSLGSGNIDPLILNAIGFKEKKARDTPFQFHEIEKIFRGILSYAENSGYPFAIIKMDSLRFHDHSISASLNLWTGPKIYFDSLVVKGFPKIKESWLASYLGIEYQQLYKEKSVQQIDDKLKNLRFAVLVSEPQLVFSKDKAKVILDLRERKINSIDGVIGFLPNASNDSKLLLTGNINLHLYNLFSSAKQLHLDWQRVKENSQTFDFEFHYPRFLKMPAGISAGLHLLKEDTIYFNRNFNLKIDFTPAPRQQIFVNTEWESSRLTGATSADIGSLEFNDYDVVYYGISYHVNRLNDVYVPTDGWFFSFDGLAGKKTVLQNSGVEDSVYQNMDPESAQYKLKLRIEKYFPLPKSFVGRMNISSGAMLGKNLFVNDLFRLGGLNTLRGFNENFFFLSDYILGNFEFRIQGGGDTYLFAFYDQAIVRNSISDYTDYPLGAGLGLSLSTTSGIFNFIFAAGKSQSQNFSINSAKIHFGYTGRF